MLRYKKLKNKPENFFLKLKIKVVAIRMELVNYDLS